MDSKISPIKSLTPEQDNGNNSTSSEKFYKSAQNIKKAIEDKTIHDTKQQKIEQQKRQDMVDAKQEIDKFIRDKYAEHYISSGGVNLNFSPHTSQEEHIFATFWSKNEFDDSVMKNMRYVTPICPRDLQTVWKDHNFWSEKCHAVRDKLNSHMGTSNGHFYCTGFMYQYPPTSLRAMCPDKESWGNYLKVKLRT